MNFIGAFLFLLKNIYRLEKNTMFYQMQLYYNPKTISKNVAVSANRVYLSSCNTHNKLAVENF
jgi:hypothetical protein